MLRKIGSYFLGLVILPALLLLALEGVARLAVPENLVLLKIDWWLIDRRDGQYPYVNRPGFEGAIYQRFVRINAQHLRGPAVQTDGRPRLLLLGDSVLFGLGVGQDDAPTPVLGALLADSVQVLNSSTIGYSTAHQLAWLREFGDGLQPDYVVLGYCLNDPLPRTLSLEMLEARRALGYWAGQLSTVLLWLNAHSYLYRVLISWYHDVGDRIGASFVEEATTLFDGPAWQTHEDELRAIVAWCRARGIPLGLVVFPLRDQLNLQDARADWPQRQLQAFAETHQVPFLDLMPRLQWSDFLRGDRYHLNAAGLRESLDAAAVFFGERLAAPPPKGTEGL